MINEVKVAIAVCLGICILGAAGGITYYFQSIFGGFSVAPWKQSRFLLKSR